MEVEDEFAFSEDDHAGPPKSSKTILKKRMSSPPPPPKEVSSTSETTSDVTSTEAEVISNEPEPSLASQTPVEAPVSSSEAMVRHFIFTQQAKNFKKFSTKKLVKSNKSIFFFCEIAFLAVLNFSPVQK